MATEPRARHADGEMLEAVAHDSHTSRPTPTRELRLVVADDNEAVRTLFVALLEDVAGAGSVISAADGVEAVQLARAIALDVAILDLNMPRLDGIQAAREMSGLQPTLAVALHSPDPHALRLRADGLGLPLFDKVEFDRLVAWVKDEIARRSGLASAARGQP